MAERLRRFTLKIIIVNYREFPKFQECGFKSHQCHFFIIDEGGDGRKSYYIAVYMKALELIIEPFF